MGRQSQKVLDLPREALEAMMDAVGVKIPDKLNDKDFLSGCQKTLWVTPDTPLPQDSNIRYLKTLRQFANARIEDLEFTYMKQAEDWSEDMWSVETSTLHWKLDEDLTVELPTLPAGAQWILTDAASPREPCMVCPFME